MAAPAGRRRPLATSVLASLLIAASHPGALPGRADAAVPTSFELRVEDALAPAGDRWIEGSVRLVYVLDPPGVAVGGFRLTEDDDLLAMLDPVTDPASVTLPDWPSSTEVLPPVPKVPVRAQVDGILTRVAGAVLAEIHAGAGDDALLGRVARSLLGDPAVRGMVIEGRTASLELDGPDPVTLRVRIPDQAGMARIGAHVARELERARLRVTARHGPQDELVAKLVPEARGGGVLAWLHQAWEERWADASRAADAVAGLAASRALDPDSALTTPYPGRTSHIRILTASHPDRSGWIAVAARGVELRTLLDRIQAVTGLDLDTAFALRRRRITVASPGMEPPLVAVHRIAHTNGLQVVMDPARPRWCRLDPIPGLDARKLPNVGRRLWRSDPRLVEADWLVCGTGTCGEPHSDGGLVLRDWRTGEVTSRLPGPRLGEPHHDPSGHGIRIGVAGGGQVTFDLADETWWARRSTTSLSLLGPIDEIPAIPGTPILAVDRVRPAPDVAFSVFVPPRYRTTTPDGLRLEAGAIVGGVVVLEARHPDGTGWTTPLPSLPTTLVLLDGGEEVVVPGEDGWGYRVRLADGVVLSRAPLQVPHGGPAVSVGVAVFHVTRGAGLGASMVR